MGNDMSQAMDLYRCGRCGGFASYYMVSDDVWKEVARGARYLCLGCVEQTFGRPLTIEDFPAVAVNALIHFGHQLATGDEAARRQLWRCDYFLRRAGEFKCGPYVWRRE
jgi:hypothetical protein